MKDSVPYPPLEAFAKAHKSPPDGEGLTRAGSIGSLLSGPTPTPNRILVIPSALDQQMQDLHRVIDLLSELHSRLIPVLTSPKGEDSGSGQEVPHYPQYVEIIHSNTRMVNQIGAGIEDILSRLEV